MLVHATLRAKYFSPRGKVVLGESRSHTAADASPPARAVQSARSKGKHPAFCARTCLRIAGLKHCSWISGMEQQMEVSIPPDPTSYSMLFCYPTPRHSLAPRAFAANVGIARAYLSLRVSLLAHLAHISAARVRCLMAKGTMARSNQSGKCSPTRSHGLGMRQRTVGGRDPNCWGGHGRVGSRDSRGYVRVVWREEGVRCDVLWWMCCRGVAFGIVLALHTILLPADAQAPITRRLTT
jgi:hypothetical protein